MTATIQKPQIVAWMKPSCGWSQGVRAVLRKYELPFEDRDIINNPDHYQQMVEKTGQMLQPSLEINGQILADVSGEDVERWLLQSGLVTPNSVVPAVPIDQPCAHEMPGAAPAASGIAFRR